MLQWESVKDKASMSSPTTLSGIRTLIPQSRFPLLHCRNYVCPLSVSLTLLMIFMIFMIFIIFMIFMIFMIFTIDFLYPYKPVCIKSLLGAPELPHQWSKEERRSVLSFTSREYNVLLWLQCSAVQWEGKHPLKLISVMNHVTHKQCDIPSTPKEIPVGF